MAQQNYAVKNYLVEEGLPHNVINQILQDKKGFIWLATYNGLSKYDGYTFKNYKSRPSDKVFMKKNRIDRIVEDKYGRIWIRSNSAQSNTYCFNPETESFWSTSLIKNPSVQDFPLTKIISQKSGYVWLISETSGCILVKDAAFNTEVYNQKSGNLPAASVRFVYEDKQQNSWLLTDNGITLIKKSKLEKPIHYFSNKNTVAKAFHTAIELEDEIWFGASNGKIVKYSKTDHTFRTSRLEIDANITRFEKLNDQTILAISDQKGFATVDIHNHNVQIYDSKSYPQLKTADLVPISIVQNHLFWFVRDNEKGIYLFDFNTQKLKYFLSDFQETKNRSTSEHAFVFSNKKGEIWVQPNGGKFSRFDPATEKLVPLTPESSHNQVKNFHCAYFDKQGNLWYSSQASGLTKISFSNHNFKTFPLLDSEVRCIFQQKNGNVWVSTKGNQLILLDKNLNKIGHLSPSGSLAEKSNWNKTIYSITEDSNATIWIGTRGDGLYKFVPVKAFNYKATHYKNEKSNPYSLSNDDIYSVYQDKKNQIWIGTLDGINLLSNNKFIHYKNDWKSYPKTDFKKVRCMSHSGNLIYAGTTDGLLVFNPNKINGKVHHYEIEPNSDKSLSGNDIIDICVTRKNDIFLATSDGGIDKVIQKDALSFPLRFKSFKQGDGLPSDNIISLQEDANGEIWVAADYNLTRFNPGREVFEVFPQIKLITKGQNFSEATKFRLQNNELLFGYANGILHFFPDQIKSNSFSPYLALTDFKVMNQKEPANKPLFDTSIDNSKELVLKHNQNFFKIEFAALDYTNSSNIKYAYKLEGFDENWNYVQNQNSIIYTNVPKGDYIFKIKSTNSQGIWVENKRQLPIIVRPSIWNTTVFYIFYVILILAILFLINYTLITIYRLKTNVKVEKRMSDMKQKFFIDISHEIRTPLTLISGPIEYLINDNRTPEPVKQQLSYVSQSSNRLLRLVNQILDLRKFQDVSLEVSEINIAEFVKAIFNDFVEIAKEQQINFTFHEEAGNTKIWADKNGLEKIIMNLLSNAFKYTPNGKSIKVRITKDENQIAIDIIDEGIGISQEKIGRLFTRFVSFNQKRSNPSTGIGLSLVKELIEKHNGSLNLISEPDKGSTFSVYLKLGKEHFPEDVVFDLEEKNPEIPDTEEISVLSLPKNNSEKIKILIVEDDVKLRKFITNILESDYQVLEAENGKIGYQMIMDENPDFIISDIMMPEMNGIELLKKIRTNIETSHVPVILLTAKTTIESQLEGLTYGADDYITKPFSVSYLKARIENLLNQRKRLQEIFGAIEETEFKEFNPKPHLISDQDEEIMLKVIQIIEENIDNNDFSVEDLGSFVGLNRTTFYYKIKSLTGYSPVEFIRDIRIKRAAQLITTNQLLIKEIAYMTGFSDIKYFNKSFKKKYGVTPMEYRKQHK
ncbi:hybrid sensor histidine kinase/response regulator [Flavobacterium limi]|uniref:histidine kinase n=1 Tax=Flavobacterium limi TaxID=2045105 RepID=A0ABQ1UQ21_9FLAO|nr:hybrid sensor histidine kinase/response regulator [Flavobacterium limi]